MPRWLSVCTFVGTALAVLGGCGGGRDSDTAPAPEGATAPAGPPSIVLVSLDTTRADRLGCYGYAGAETPTLDALAAAGVVFEETSSPAPITLPAHASLMTGLGPHRHGVRDNGLHRLPDDLDTLGTILRARGYATAAVVGAAVLDRQYGLDAGFATWDDRMGGGALLAIPERDAAAVTDAALAAAADLEPPFLLFVHYFDPHADYRPPPPFAERFRDRPYDGEIAFVDRELGRLLDGLRAAGALDGAVVSVVADHGESLGEHGERAHGVLLYRSTLRVPWILSAPGRLPAGRRVATFARLTDVMPTLVELAGASAPSGLDGTSLVAAARGTAATPDTPWLPIESELGYNSYGWAPLRGITDGRLKWIRAPRPELYDLVADPEERTNVIAERADDAARLAGTWASLVSGDRRAPPPGLESDAAAAERMRDLGSLGYVSAPRRAPTPAENLPDPKDEIGTVERLNEARRALAGRRFADAARLADEIRRAEPRNLSARVLLGSTMIEGGRPDLAVAPLAEAAALAPANADVQYNLGLALLATGDDAGAERAWDAALAVAPRYLEAAANLADLLQGTGRAPEARAVVARAREHGLDAPVLDFLDGRLALERGEAAAARAALDRALAGGLPAPIERQARELRQRAAAGS